MDVNDNLNLQYNKIENVCLGIKTGHNPTKIGEFYGDSVKGLPAYFNGTHIVYLANENKFLDYALSGHNHDGTYEAKNSNIQQHIAETNIHLTKERLATLIYALDSKQPFHTDMLMYLDSQDNYKAVVMTIDNFIDYMELYFEGKNTNIQEHISDTVIHVTGSDKTAWNSKLDYNTTINSLDTVDKRLNFAINEINAIAKGAGDGISPNDIEAMCLLLNAAGPTDYPYGKNINIIDYEAPDYWINTINSTSVPYTYVDDETFLEDIGTGSLQIGYYTISKLDSQKVNLSDYYTKNSTDTLLGAKEDTSNKSSNIETDKASTTKYGAVKAIYDWATGLFFKISDIVTSWSAILSDSKVASEKLVKHDLDLKSNLAGGNTFSGNQNFDSNTLFIDSVNHRIGVGNNAPTNSFHVSGDIINTGNYISSASEIQIQMSSGYYTVFRGVRAASSWIDSKDTQWFQIGNENDYVAFTSKSGIPIKRYGIFASTTQISPTTGANVPTGLFEISDYTNPLFNVLLNGNVGIGNTNPTSKLDVNGTSNFNDNMNMLSTKNQYLAASPTADTVDDIRVRNDSGVLKTERCTVANATKGAGTWVDASKADITPATGATSALTQMFVILGKGDVVFNSSTGYFEMFGITDISLTEMIEIHSLLSVQYTTSLTSAFAKWKGLTCRTVYRFPFINSGLYTVTQMFMENTYIQQVRTMIASSVYPPQIIYATYMFGWCTNLINGGAWYTRYANPSTLLNMVIGCVNLEELLLFKLTCNFSFSDSPKINLTSLQYLVTNRDNGTTRITITVHATVWAKLNDSVNYPTWNALLVDAFANQYIDFGV